MNDEIVSVSSTAPVAASVIWTCSFRPWLSQSRKYSSRSCDWPSVMLTSTVKLVLEYQVAAMRPEPPGFWSARLSDVLLAQVQDDWPAGVTVTLAGYLGASPMTL